MGLTITVASGWQVGTNTATSGTVSGVAGDMLVATTYSNSNFASFSASNGQAWTQASTDGFGGRVFYRILVGSESTTVTVTSSSSIGAAVKVYKAAGQSATPIGATGSTRLNSTANYTPTIFTSTVPGSLALFTACDINAAGIPSSSDLTATTFDETGAGGFGQGLGGWKTLGAAGAQTANVQSPGSPSWCWTAIEILPAPLAADVASTTTFSSTVTATAASPTAVTGSTTFSSTVAANTTQPAAVSSSTAFSSTLTIPVPRVTSATAFASIVTAAATPPLPAVASGTTTFSSTVTAFGAFSAQVTSTTSFRSRVTATRTGAQPVVAPYGPLQIGRITLTEPIDVDQKSGDTRVVTLSGLDADQTFYHPTQAQIRARMEQLLAYAGQTVPVRFSAFPHLDGWYVVGSPGAGEFGWYDTTAVEWSLDLTRVGADAEMEIESRLIGGNRSHASAAAAELWHAPPVGADAYTVGSSSPGWVTRIGADGVSYVYRALPAGGNPRYGVTVAQAMAGAATATVSGEVRTGLTCPDSPTSWALSNGLLRVQPRTSTGTLILTSYLTSGWGTPKVFDLKRGAASLGMAAHVTLLRNTTCEVVLRLTWDTLPGRVTCDLSLRRGSRFVGLHLQQSVTSSPMRVDDNGAASGTISDDHLASAGYIASSVDDGDGNRWIIGSPLSCATPGTLGLVANVTAAAMPAYVGAVRAGASAVSGDAAVDVNAQYLGSPAETERVIRR